MGPPTDLLGESSEIHKANRGAFATRTTYICGTPEDV